MSMLMLIHQNEIKTMARWVSLKTSQPYPLCITGRTADSCKIESSAPADYFTDNAQATSDYWKQCRRRWVMTTVTTRPTFKSNEGEECSTNQICMNHYYNSANSMYDTSCLAGRRLADYLAALQAQDDTFNNFTTQRTCTVCTPGSCSRLHAGCAGKGWTA